MGGHRMEYLEKIGRQAKEAEVILRTLSTGRKNEALYKAAEALERAEDKLIAANGEDVICITVHGDHGRFVEHDAPTGRKYLYG